MLRINVIIVDDEPIAQEILQKFCKKIPFLNVVEICDNAIVGLELIECLKPDLIFLDVQMPQMSGLEMMRIIRKQGAIIILTTAFAEHAVESYELDVLDYLLKPIAYDRFLKAVNKARQQIKLRSTHSSPVNSESPEYIFIKADNKLNKIQFKNILYIEAVKDYIKIFNGENYTLTHFTMKAIEEKLPAGKFIRIHHSFIVQLNAIKSLMGNSIELINGVSLPLSKSHKDDLLAALQIIKSP